MPNFTERARNYIQRSPQCEFLNSYKRERLIRGIAKLMSEAFRQGRGYAEHENDRANQKNKDRKNLARHGVEYV